MNRHNKGKSTAAISLFLFIWLVLTQTGFLEAQEKLVSWQCPYCLRSWTASSDEQANRDYQEHLRREHPDKIGVPHTEYSRPASPLAGLILGGIAGAIAGGIFAMAGGYQIGSPESIQYAAYGALGCGLFFMLLRVVNSNSSLHVFGKPWKYGRKWDLSVFSFGSGGGFRFSW